MKKLEIREITRGTDNANAALRETRSVRLAGARRETGVYDRSKLLAGNVIEGPAIIEEPAHVTVIFPGDVLRVDAFGNLIVTIGSEVQA